MKWIISGIVVVMSACAMAAPEGTLSVHILNQQTGLPSQGVNVALEKQNGEVWQRLAAVKTDKDGRVTSLFPSDKDMDTGVYKVTFYTGEYFKKKHQPTFFPSIPVIFSVSQKNQKLHIPLLLSQFGYSTYRGS